MNQLISADSPWINFLINLFLYGAAYFLVVGYFDMFAEDARQLPGFTQLILSVYKMYWLFACLGLVNALLRNAGRVSPRQSQAISYVNSVLALFMLVATIIALYLPVIYLPAGIG